MEIFKKSEKWEANQARKNQKYPELRQSYSGSRKGIDGRKTKKIQNKTKRTLTYFDKLQQSQVKNTSMKNVLYLEISFLTSQ